MGRNGTECFWRETILHKSGNISQTILAVGHQDVDPSGLQPPPGIEILGASSDHLITDTGSCNLSVGDEISFQLNYSALVGTMTSPFIAKLMRARGRVDCIVNRW